MLRARTEMSGPFLVYATTVAALRSVVTYVAIVLYILIIGPPGLLLTWLSRSKRLLYALGHGGVGLALGVSGIRYRIAAGQEQRPIRHHRGSR